MARSMRYPTVFCADAILRSRGVAALLAQKGEQRVAQSHTPRNARRSSSPSAPSRTTSSSSPRWSPRSRSPAALDNAVHAHSKGELSAAPPPARARGDAVTPAAQRGDCRAVLLCHTKGPHRGGARSTKRSPPRAARATSAWAAARQDRASPAAGPAGWFSADAERLPAGRQDAQLRTAVEQLAGQSGASVDAVLAVVQNEQHLPRRQVLDQ
jgi:hypothetical protein